VSGNQICFLTDGACDTSGVRVCVYLGVFDLKGDTTARPSE